MLIRLTLPLLLALTAVSATQLNQLSQSRRNLADELEVLYLPSREGVEALAFGYKNFLSSLLWIKTISYFGRHYREDGVYKWLGHMCDLVTALNPRAEHAYLFCSMMLSWEANQATKSEALLTRAIDTFPQNWRYYYHRGFNRMHFLHDAKGAKDDFIAASILPEAPVFVATLASKKLAELEDPAEAVQFLERTIEATSDPTERAVLQYKLEKLKSAE